MLRGYKKFIFDFKEVRLTIRNWYLVPLIKYGLIKNATFITISGKKIKIYGIAGYNDFFNNDLWFEERINAYKGRIKKFKSLIVLDGKLKFRYYTLSDYRNARSKLLLFFDNEYYIPIKGRTIVDIGANIADTAIFFVLKGAKNVIAYEPFPNSFKLAEENILLNNMKDRILLSNVAVGGQTGVIALSEKSIDTVTLNALAEKNPVGKRVKVITLKNITEKFPQKDMIVKMDCEGCEYDAIISSSDKTLRHFEQFVIEHHDRGSYVLIDRLNKAHFKTRVDGNLLYAYRLGSYDIN